MSIHKPDRQPAPRSLQSAELITLILGVAGLLGNVALAALAPPPAFHPPAYLLYQLIWIAAIAIALNLNITIDAAVSMNFASFFVLAAFLTFGPGAAIGVLVGGLLVSETAGWLSRRLRHASARTLRTVLLSMSYHLMLEGIPLAAGVLVYYALGGVIPVVPPSAIWDIPLPPVFLPALLALEITYFVVSIGANALLLKLHDVPLKPFVAAHWAEVTLLGLLPILLSSALALAALNMPLVIFAGACVIVVLSIGITYGFSRARGRLERRVRELDSLTAIGQIVANSLELPEVLEAIYQQTSRLMETHNFYIALYDENERRINFPLVYENNQRVEYASRDFSEGFTEYIILSRQPLLIKGDAQDFAQQIGQTPAELQTRSWLGVPIAIGERVLGVITVQSHEKANLYDESHRDILISIAAQAATAIRNSQMYMELRRQTSNLFIINSVLTAVNSTLKLDEVLDIIVTSLPQVMGCQKAAIFLADDRRQTAMLAAAHNLSSDYVAQYQAATIQRGTQTNVIATGELLLVSDVLTAEYLPQAKFASTEKFRALAEFPLWAQDQPIGSIAAYYAEPHSFTPNEIEELTAFANQAAVAVANARLYAHADQALARRIEQLATLQQIGLDLVASLDLDEVMLHLLERATTAVGAMYGAVGLWDEERAVTRVAVTYGYPPAAAQQISQVSWPIGSGLVGRAVRTGQSLFVSDVRHESDYVATLPDVRSELVVLLKKENRVLGVINLESPEVGRFDEAALNFIDQLALQAVIALENAQLYRTAQSRLREMSILYEIGQRLTSILDLRQLGSDLTALMAQALNATYCGLQILEPAAGMLVTIGKYLSPSVEHAESLARPDESFRLADYPELQAAIERHELLINYRDDPEPSYLERRQAGLHALFDLPLVLGTRPIGVVEWGDERPGHRFSLGEIQFARTLASQATIAIHNARLFEDRTRRLRNLNDLYQASLGLSISVEIEEVLRRTSAVALEVSRADAVTVYVYDERADTFTRAHALGVTGDWSPAHLRRAGMTWRVVKEGKPVLVNETIGHPEVNPHTIEAGIRSLIAVPLVSQGRPIGVMYVGSFQPHRFDEGDAQLVTALANQAAVAIANARLFSEIAENRDQLQAILDSASDGLLIFDLASRIVLVNPCLEVMWDVPHGWLNDRRLLDLLDEPDLNLAEKMGYPKSDLRRSLELLRSGQSLEWGKHIYALPGRTPSQYVERSVQPVLDVERLPIGWMMVLRDVSEELELQRIRDDLNNTIIHDLRSPLSSILGSLYFIEEMTADSGPDSPIGQALTISIRSANKLINLINSLLDIARLGSGQSLVELQSLRMEPVIDAAVEHLWPLAADSQVAIVKDVDHDLPLVLIDEDKIHRVVVNLVDNALKFAPRGSLVRIKVERWPVNGMSYVRCAIIDNGPGIPIEYRHLIFERFSQLPQHQGRRRGTGIGLNFCQLAIEAHGGKIWIEDTPGGGSTFAFIVKAVAD
jgi:GAF domain-containing protein